MTFRAAFYKATRPGLQGVYSYPHDGWRWFDSEDQARGYFGIQEDQKEYP